MCVLCAREGGACVLCAHVEVTEQLWDRFSPPFSAYALGLNAGCQVGTASVFAHYSISWLLLLTVVQAGLSLPTLLPQPLEHWDLILPL